MQVASELSRLSLTIKVVTMLVDKHPTMNLAAAEPILIDLIVQAMCDGNCEGSIEQHAVDIWCSSIIQGKLPPWQS